MTLVEFNKVSYDDKLFKVVDKGTFIDNNVTNDIRLNCYSLNRFFVELVYDSEKNNILKIRAFEDGDELNKYSSHYMEFIK